MERKSARQFVVVGLGNPGPRYEMTRHNMGAIVVQGLVRSCGLFFKEEKRFSAKVAKMQLAGATIYFVLPTTYMNESGIAVRKVVDYFKVQAVDVIVVSDDADLAFGELRLKQQGSSGGHNGLKSVESYLGTAKYLRLRVGIGRQKERGQQLSGYVLDRFSKNEEEALLNVVEKGGKALKMLFSEPVEAVMNLVNSRPKESKDKKLNPKNTLAGDKQEE